jgi:Fur family ferric uptake transcriptional regulator
MDSRMEGILGLVRERGGRVTTPTRAVVQVLEDASDHLTAADIAQAVRQRHPDIHGSTIYRVLDRLTELGVVSHAHLGSRPAVYHLISDQHDHLVCERCGAVLDVPPTVMRPVARRVARDYGFELTAGHFALGGLCVRCSAN